MEHHMNKKQRIDTAYKCKKYAIFFGDFKYKNNHHAYCHKDSAYP